MKKLLFAFGLILLLSCSNDSDENKSSSNSSFHPPSWIQATWKDEISFGYRFSSDNFCSILLSSENCNKEYFELIKKTGITVTIIEDISSTEYKFSYILQGQSISYHFVKISEKEIQLVNPIQGQPNASFFKQ